MDSGFNEAYRITRKIPKKNPPPSISITSTSSSSGTESDSLAGDDPTYCPKPELSPLNGSNTFPRCNETRKIQNINIELPIRPFPDPTPVVTAAHKKPTSPRTLYTKTKNFEMSEDVNSTCSTHGSTTSSQEHTYTSFLIADVEPGGVKTRVEVYAGLDSGNSSDDEAPPRCSPTPNTRFFASQKKSTELERIVQINRSDSGNRSLIQEIIGELDRSIAENRSVSGGGPLEADSRHFVKGLVSALEKNYIDWNYDGEVGEDSDDSDLAKSTSISFKSYDSADELPTSPLPQLQVACSSQGEESEQSEEDEEVYWIQNKIRQLPRTSSRLSMLSRGSGASSLGRNSPGLSPIKIKDQQRREEWLQQQNRAWAGTNNNNNPRAAEKASSRQRLFRIDETGVGDSGYSDRSGTTATKTPTGDGSDSDDRRSSPTTSGSSRATSQASTSPTGYGNIGFIESRSSGPYVLKSFMV